MKSKAKHILIIDDDLISIKAIEYILTKACHCVFKSSKAQVALEFLKENYYKFDLILIDRNMPSNGINLLEEIKEDPKLKEIPVLMESVSEDQEAWFTAKELGALDWLYKPITERYLLYSIKQILD